jgi:hypothetical protein
MEVLTMKLFRWLFKRRDVIASPPAFTIADLFADILAATKDDFYTQCVIAKLTDKITKASGLPDWQKLELNESRAHKLIPIFVSQVGMEIQDCQALFQLMDKTTVDINVERLKYRASIVLLIFLKSLRCELPANADSLAADGMLNMSDEQFKLRFQELLANFCDSLI